MDPKCLRARTRRLGLDGKPFIDPPHELMKRLAAEGPPLRVSQPWPTHHVVAVAETQETISYWGQETFGPSHALEKAARMNVEVTELLTDLGSVVNDPLLQQLLKANMQLGEALCARVLECAQRGAIPPALDVQGKECADVLVVLYQVAEATGVRLLAEADAKMAVNRKRKWGKLASGRFQHS